MGDHKSGGGAAGKEMASRQQGHARPLLPNYETPNMFHKPPRVSCLGGLSLHGVVWIA
jgi:hypothetical protein